MSIDKHDVKHVLHLAVIVVALLLGGDLLWSGFYWVLGAYLAFRVAVLVTCLWAVNVVRRKVTKLGALSGVTIKRENEGDRT